jgi:hypothetical protein
VRLRFRYFGIRILFVIRHCCRTEAQPKVAQGRAVGAIFAASSSLDAEQTAPLNFFAWPMLQMNRATSRNQIEE